MSEWKEFKIGEIFKLRQGRYVNSDIMSDSSSTEKPYPVFGGNGVRGYVDFYEYEKSQAIVTCRGNGCGLIQFLPPKSTITNSSIAFELKDDSVEMEFLYYWAKNADFSEVTSGSAQPQITIGDISSKEILLPPLPEQKAIAEVLTSLDDKIDLLHKQNKTLEQLAETLFRHHFIDNAKDDWEDGNVTDEFSLTMGQSPSGNSFNEEGFGIPMFQGNADFEFRFPKKRIYTTEPKKFAEKYDTLISVRAPVGEQNMASERCCIGRGVAAFRYKNEQNFYSYTYFKMKSLMEEIKQFNQTGTVFGSISKTDFENLKITIPSFDEVSNFQEKIFPIDSKIITNCDQIKSLEKLRDQLLPKLMSGEILINKSEDFGND